MLQTIGNSLQLLGAVITGAGLFHAWNRASGRLDAWRKAMQRGFGELNTFLVSGGTTFKGAAEDTALQIGLTATGEVGRSHTPEERLLTLEMTVVALVESLSSIPKIDEAIATELDRFKSLSDVIAVKDIYCALAGVAVGAIGIAVAMCA
jgi:hypothetical protein